MARLPVYFEQRLLGTIDVDKNGPGFTYDPNWIRLRGAFPISTTVEAVVDGGVRAIFGWAIAPARARLEHVNDAANDAPIVVTYRPGQVRRQLRGNPS